MNTLRKLLMAGGSIVVNKELARIIGLHQAVFFVELLAKEDYFERKGQLKDGWFFNTIENMEKDTTLSVFQQREVIRKLRELKLIDYKVEGLPATRYFKINGDRLCELLDIRPPKTSIRETHKLDKEKLNGNNNKDKNNKEISYIYSFWNKQGIIVHRDLDKFKGSINGVLKRYSKEEILTAIANYKEILDDKDSLLTHDWTLKEFLTRGIDKFLNLETAKKSYKRWGTNKTPSNRIVPTEEELAQYDNIEEVYNQKGERIK